MSAARTWRRRAFLALDLALVALGVYFLVSAGLQGFGVIGTSMEPTLYPGETVLASAIPYRFGDPARGDVVLMRDPLDPSQILVKRVIGLPGDRIRIHNFKVMVNGHPLNEPYLRGERWAVTRNWPEAGNSAAQLVPANSYFVLGDNRDESGDSRLFGYVPRKQIEERVLAVAWPVWRFDPL